MAMDPYFQEMTAQCQLNENGASLKNWNSMTQPIDESENNHSGGFDCNICLDSVQEPVVTLCGHLYCWPCIYKWIHLQSISSENSDQQEPQCPVCKAEVSQKTLIPLYGRGLSSKSSEGKAQNPGVVIPQRPQSPRCAASTLIATTTSNNAHHAEHTYNRNYSQLHQQYHPYPGGYMASPVLSLGGATTNVSHPMVGMFGEMVYARIFGNSESTFYSYPNSYNYAGSPNRRIRRQIMEVDRSLSRLCFFLFCCMVLCLLLF